MSMPTIPVFGIETSRHITRIIEQLPCELPDENVFVCMQLNINRSLYFVRKDGAITQIGVCLFSPEMRIGLDDRVCNTVERLWLELALCNSIQQQKQLLNEYGVSFVLNGFPLGTTQFPILNKALDAITDSSTLSMKLHEGKIAFRIESENLAIEMILPADRELLFAYDKKEHEDVLIRELESWTDTYKHNPFPNIGELVSIANGLYFLPGEAYMVDSLNNETFYQLKSDQVDALYDQEYPDLSLRNLLMGCVDLNGVNLNVRYHTYDRTERFCKKPMSYFMGYMQGQGLDFYAATISYAKDDVYGILVMHHPIYEYIHMLIIHGDISLFHKEQVELKGDFYTFIPQHNVKWLF